MVTVVSSQLTFQMVECLVYRSDTFQLCSIGQKNLGKVLIRGIKELIIIIIVLANIS